MPTHVYKGILNDTLNNTTVDQYWLDSLQTVSCHVNLKSPLIMTSYVMVSNCVK